MNSKTIRYALVFAAALAAVAILLIPDTASAASAAGAGMQYSQGLNRFTTSIRTEIAFALIIIGVVVGVGTYIVGGEMSGMLQTVMRVIIGACIIGGVATFLTTIGVTGALI